MTNYNEKIIESRDENYRLLLSKTNVTGQSFTRHTSIIAPNSPDEIVMSLDFNCPIKSLIFYPAGLKEIYSDVLSNMLF